MTELKKKRGPGRPRKADTVKKLPRRRRQMGVDFNLKLSIPKEWRERLESNGFVGRWINDTDGRNVKFNTLDDWEYVTYAEMGEGEVGEDNLDARSVGGNISRQVGGGVVAYLMKKRKEFYNEDQAEKERLRTGIEDQIRANQYKNEGENTYIPKEGIKLSRGK